MTIAESTHHRATERYWPTEHQEATKHARSSPGMPAIADPDRAALQAIRESAGVTLLASAVLPCAKCLLGHNPARVDNRSALGPT